MKYNDPERAHGVAGIPFIKETWEGNTFSDNQLASVTFLQCTFKKVRWQRTEMTQLVFVKCSFEECVFEDCKMAQVTLVECRGNFTAFGVDGELKDLVMSESKFDNVSIGSPGMRIMMSRSEIERLSFDGAGTRQSTLTVSDSTFGEFLAENARWKYACIVNFDMSCGTWTNAQMQNCALIGCRAEAFDFTTIEFDTCNLFECEFPKARLRKAKHSILAKCNLTDADFTDAQLENILFAESNLARANMERTMLDRSLFPKAKLQGANIAGASMQSSVWIDADLTDANLDRVDAFRSVFRNAVMKNTSLAGASFIEADLHGVKDADFSGANTLNSRGTIEWRAELEDELREGDKAEAEKES